MLKKPWLPLVVLLCVCIAAHAHAQLAAPEPISPGFEAGVTPLYSAPRTPTFSWSPVANANWYMVWLSEEATGVKVLTKWVKGGTTWTPDATSVSLDPGEQYKWWVCAWNSQDGYGPWSKRFDFVAGNVNVIHLGPDSFVGYTPDDTCRYYFGGGALEPLQDRENEFVAPLVLPHDARIYRIHATIYNNDVVSTVSKVELYRSNRESVDRQYMGELTIVNNQPGAHVDTSYNIAHDVIDCVSYCYFVRLVLPSSNNWFTNFRIDYWD